MAPDRSPPPLPEREPPPDRFRLRPPPDRAGVAAVGATLPGGAGRVSPTLGRSPRSVGAIGAVGAEVDAASDSATAAVDTASEPDRPFSAGTLAGRGATCPSSSADSPSSCARGLLPSPPDPVRLRPRPPREPRRLRLAVPGPPVDSLPASTIAPPPTAVAVASLGGLGAAGGRTWAARTGAGEAGFADRGASEAPGVCPVGTSDIGFLSETVHEARSMACMARSVPAGTTRPRSGS